MQRFRPSILGLMGAILVLAMAFAALRSGSGVASQAIGLLVFFALATATGGAIFAGGRARAAWGGASLFGWQFLAFLFLPGFPSPTPPPMFARTLAVALHPYALSPSPISGQGQVEGEWIFMADRQVWGLDRGNRIRHTERTVIGLANLLYMALGAAVVWAIARGPRDERDPSRPPSDESPGYRPGTEASGGQVSGNDDLMSATDAHS